MIVPATNIALLASERDATLLVQTLHALARATPAFVRLIERSNTSIRALEPFEKFADVTRAYRLFDSVEYGVCGGLYDPENKLVVLREKQPWVLVHELQHVMDWTLGDGKAYRSDLDDRIRASYERQRGLGLFISAYASLNRQELVAESARALAGYGPRRPGRLDDQTRLRRIDPPLVSILEGWLAEVNARYCQPAAAALTCLSFSIQR